MKGLFGSSQLFSALLVVACASPASTKDTTSSSSPAVSPAVVRPQRSEHPPIDLEASRKVRLNELPWRSKEELEQLREAGRLLARGDAAAAVSPLRELTGSAAALLRARIYRQTGELEEASRALEQAKEDPPLAALIELERGLIAADADDVASATQALGPLVTGERSVAERAVMPLLNALERHNPEMLLREAASLEKVLPKEEVDARSLWWAAQAKALESLDRAEEAREVHLRRFLEEPVSLETPTSAPAGASPTALQLLVRAEILLEAHRNERVLEELPGVEEKKLTAEERCRKSFALGLASRKLRKYAPAEKHLGAVVERCRDEELVRRAMYLQTKVISIRDGLRAVPMIEKFARRFAGHSMVDDVLFWAGDLYQRRQRWAEATKFYRRIQKLPGKGDYCGEARWRLAWISYRQGKLRQATIRLERLLLPDGCAPSGFDRARANYWLGRLKESPKDSAAAIKLYRRAIEIEALGFYGQLSLSRIELLASAVADEIARSMPAPPAEQAPALCPGFLAASSAFQWGAELLVRGLDDDAARAFRSVEVPNQKVLGGTHAASLGLKAKPPKSVASASASSSDCRESEPLLLLALMLDRAGAYREAHWRLRTDFKSVLSRRPLPEDGAIWYAAYPLAFRDLIEPAEQEAGLPSLFLQALSREESALDPKVVSWAGAYGLTQLLLSSGQLAGKLLDPPVRVARAEDLLEPAINARLGAALLGSLVRKFDGNLALALAGYNAGDHVALTWWKRHQGQSFDRFSEEMTIKETRGYVKRVLKTYGIYRWLYDGKQPMLPIERELPVR